MFDRFYLEWKIRSPIFRWLFNLLLTVVIYYAAEAGSTFGISGLALEFSLIWPAAGISLAAIMLFGYKALPGVFFGNFIYNFVALQDYDPSLVNNSFAAAMVAIGSSLQAFVAGWIVRKYNTYEYFNTLRDVLIFLIPAGLIACFIATFVGNITLLFYGGLIDKNFFYTWITFWLGDLIGVYTFTPLIVIWMLSKPPLPTKKSLIEAFFITIFFVLVSYATFFWDYRLTHLYLPLCIWFTFYFSLHGATLVVFLTSALTIVLTSLGYGPFVFNDATINPLLFLVSFLEVNIATTLIIGVVLQEREQTKLALERANVDLTQDVHDKLEEIRDIYYEMFLKEKEATIGKKTSDITQKIMSFLQEIRKSATKSYQLIDRMQHKLDVPSTSPSDLQVEIDQNRHLIASILKTEDRAYQIADTFVNHIGKSFSSKLNIKSVKLHDLLDNRLSEAEEREEIPELEVAKEYSPQVRKIAALPWELAYAFDQMISRSLRSIKEKQDMMAEGYQPVLKIITRKTINGVDIVFLDNGRGVPKQELASFFHPFLSEEMTADETDLGLSLAYDIIVNIHHGQVHVESKEGEFLQINVKLLKQVEKGIFRSRKLFIS